MTTFDQDISIAEARKETLAYIEKGAENLRTRLKEKKLTHA